MLFLLHFILTMLALLLKLFHSFLLIIILRPFEAANAVEHFGGQAADDE
jgi:hypothetical protein